MIHIYLHELWVIFMENVGNIYHAWILYIGFISGILVKPPTFNNWAAKDSEHEFPEKKLDLYKLESKPVVLFQAATMCHLVFFWEPGDFVDIGGILAFQGLTAQRKGGILVEYIYR